MVLILELTVNYSISITNIKDALALLILYRYYGKQPKYPYH